MKIIRINKGKAVNLPIKLISVLIVAVATIKLMDSLAEPWSILIAIVLGSFVPAIWFATEVIIIDMENKEIFEGVWTMGKRLGKPVSFQKIEKIFINRVKTKQNTYSLSNQQHISTNYEFRAYLKIDDGQKFFLISHPIEDRVKEKVTDIQKKLGLN